MNILIASIFFFSFEVNAKESTKSVMHDALNSLIELIPYMSDDIKFTHPDNSKKIQLYLNRLKTSFDKAGHLKLLNRKSFTPSYIVIKEQLNHAIDDFNHHDKNFAKLRINSISSICLSCHTQISKDHKTSLVLNSLKSSKDNFANTYDYANFKLLLRDYNSALNLFNDSINERLLKVKEHKKINNILGNDYETYDKELVNSFKGILLVHTKINRNPASAIKTFQRQLKNKEIPNYIKEMLKNWIAQLETWKDNPYLNQTFKNENKIKEYLTFYENSISQGQDTIKSKNHDVSLLINSGILSNYLYNHNKTQLTPQILYWLGVTENQISKNIFYTIGDLYLKECIKEYYKKPIAKKCFNEYKQEITFRYTGSLGTKLPKSISEELKNLEALIKN